MTLETPGNLVARFPNVLIQVRTGTMTMRMIDDIERTGRLMRASAPRGKVGAIVIVEETAEVSPSVSPCLRGKARAADYTFLTASFSASSPRA